MIDQKFVRKCNRLPLGKHKGYEIRTQARKQYKDDKHRKDFCGDGHDGGLSDLLEPYAPGNFV